jgi:lysophospholipase L1-like esterase
LTGTSRKLLFWYLPVCVALAAAMLFGYGFHLLFRDDVGTTIAEPVAAAVSKGPAGTVRIVVLGDSVARGTGDETGEGIGGAIDKELQRRAVAHDKHVNLGVNGAKTADLLKQLESPSIRRFVAEATIVVVSIGGNDLFGDVAGRSGDRPPDPAAAMDRTEAQVAKVIAEIRAINAEARIFYVGLYNPFVTSKFGSYVNPAVAEWSVRLNRRFSTDDSVTIVQTSDIFSHRDRLSADRFHPGAEGYRMIGRRIGESI